MSKLIFLINNFGTAFKIRLKIKTNNKDPKPLRYYRYKYKKCKNKIICNRLKNWKFLERNL